MKKIVKKWSKEEEEILAREYPINPRVHDLFPDRSYNSVTYHAWQMGLKAKGRGFIGVNHRFFDKLDRDSAYMLGFIAADGNIHGNVLSIVQKDASVLETFAEVMDIDKPYPIRRWSTGVHVLVVRNSNLVDALKSYGIEERKSLTMGKLKVPSHLMRDFVRGFIDGDGCISTHVDKRRGTTVLEVSILGTYNFLNWMQAKVHRLTNMPRRKICTKTGSKIDRIKYSGRNAVLLLTWLYQDDPTLYLERKKKVFSEYLDIYPDRGSYLYNMPCPGSKEILLGEDIVQAT